MSTWRERLAPVVAIDVGTARTRIWSSQIEAPLDEASCLAVEQPSTRVVAVGDEAAEMGGRVASKIEVIWPIRQGEVVDIELAQAFLRGLWQKAVPHVSIVQPVVMIAVPHTLSPAKRQLITEIIYKLGARDVFTISQPLASAIGAGVPIADASGSLVVSLGAGVAEAAVISLGSVVEATVSYQAGDYWNQLLQLTLQRDLGLVVGRGVTEQLKQHVASFGKPKKILITGQDVEHVAPKEVWIETNDIQSVLDKIATSTAQLVEQVLSKVPPELTVDVIDKGILLTGGGAQLTSINQVLTEQLGVAVTVADTPADTCFKGTQTALHNLDDFRQSLGYLVGSSGS